MPTYHESDPEPASTKSPRRPAAIPWLAAAGLLTFINCSCLQSTNEVEKPGQQKQQCESNRDSAIDKAKPEVLGFRFKTDEVVSELNDWLLECRKDVKSTAIIGKDAEALLARAWKPDEVQRLKRGRFDDRDAFHIRNSLLFGAIRREVAKRTTNRNNDLQQVVQLFDYTVRNVELIAEHPHKLPMPIFRVLLRGQGTVEDRAWIFASLLRQMQVPAVLLSPNSADGAASHFVVAAMLNEEIYLFDPRLGVPIPAPDADKERPDIKTPATLAQFVQDSRIARSLDVGNRKYPLQSTDLKHPRVQLIGHRSVWAPHMKQLLSPLYDRCIVYVNLEDESEGEGLITRVAGFGKGFWKKEDLEVWPYPGRVLAAYLKIDADQRSKMGELFNSFSAPRLIEIVKGPNNTNQAVLGPAKNRQFDARVGQLQGEFEESVRSYVFVRREAETFFGSRLNNDNPVARNMYERAQEDGNFWSAVSHYEQYLRLTRGRSAKALGSSAKRPLESVIKQLEQYRDRPLRSGSRVSKLWMHQCYYLLAKCHIALWDLMRYDAEVTPLERRNARRAVATALSNLESIPSDHPQKHGFEFLRKRYTVFLNRAVGQNNRKSAKRPPVVAPRPKSK